MIVTSTKRWLLLGVSLCIVLLLGAPAAAQPFLPDDPLQEDPDQRDVPMPEEEDVSDISEFFEYSFKVAEAKKGPAINVNTLGEVPNSSWYTNRHYYHPMSPEELKWGPNAVSGPKKPWTVVSGKEEGKSVGMQIVDARGDRYLFKFDPKRYPELASGAEVVVTKFFYALGYHVPENYVAYFTRDDLTLGQEAADESIDAAFVDNILAKVPRGEGSRYRAMASRLLQGEPLGPFRYDGTRPDDANDIFPHELRRELRGLKVFAAWLEHVDLRSANSLCMFVEEDGRHFVRHYLIDFGTTLGGGPISLKRRWFGKEFVLQPVAMLKRAVSLGFWGASWQDIAYPDYLSVGRIEAAHFDPEEWRGQYPVPAFSNADAADNFWAAKQVMNFSNKDIRAIVSTGQYSDSEAEQYLAETLIKRRNKIGRMYLRYGGGLDRFQARGGQLTFVDLLAKHGWADAGRVRHVIWKPYDNEADALGETLAAGEHTGATLAIPDTDHTYLMAEIRTPEDGRTRVYLRQTNNGHEVVGLNRE